MIKIGIYGASGYTGQELLRILLRHPEAEVTAVTSRRYAGRAVADIYPAFTGLTDLSFIDASPEEVAAGCEHVFLALPHAVSMNVAPLFLRVPGMRVVDLSADFRLRNLEVYEAWYGRHTAAAGLREAVYGLPELYREDIRGARLIANPGCYPTSVILGLAPLLKARWIDPRSIIADSKSGVSGAGREPQVASLFGEVAEAFKAYKVTQHRHTPEIEQELAVLAGEDLRISFTPHLLPITRGILSTIYASLRGEKTLREVHDLYREFYEREPFIRVYKPGEYPNVSAVRGANFCDLGVAVDRRTGRVIVISAIDNLIKGAAGQAVQNMNIMWGCRENLGLEMISLYP
ncbi:MAG TPA: N-acetyl-gamma-glutamyl-phosphate reductase [Syntrophales bacterium]|jgi:N-acetyl-gamma-glutamyl-phosphate reductase|nr:N-acetyl-gamma-glutamyl-phosphate reductase [Syntrophales bacterium]HON22434.1 N-acetyl-gamma-glutamyl-phosphate reductase [Syntrophales bacterium]HOU77999.1 N-acetyl-gamma-glutamyl-phosphate reductase [Syntrophales bacterium]HPC32196.1 N-acetyl-gamma-glutamyl-phosphate reductase [Syntrophales bacterium]HQG33902.1 N-acetyl-gamma-glutamyl-phosphate reductase [Syntrophales bacterium]